MHKTSKRIGRKIIQYFWPPIHSEFAFRMNYVMQSLMTSRVDKCDVTCRLAVRTQGEVELFSAPRTVWGLRTCDAASRSLLSSVGCPPETGIHWLLGGCMKMTSHMIGNLSSALFTRVYVILMTLYPSLMSKKDRQIDQSVSLI